MVFFEFILLHLSFWPEQEHCVRSDSLELELIWDELLFELVALPLPTFDDKDAARLTKDVAKKKNL